MHRSLDQTIEVRSPPSRGLAEEAPFAYRDVDVRRAGLAAAVAQLRTIGVVRE